MPWCAWQSSGIRPSGNDDLFTNDRLFCLARDFDFKATINCFGKRSTAMEKSNFVLFEQIQNAIVILFDDGIFTAKHFGHIHLHIFG